MSLSDSSMLARLRIGHGFDVHRFGEGDHLMLGGVRVDFDQGFVAHSDGDVVLHALSDALLGAAALGDIGRHFPDTDEQWRGADSRALLRHVVSLINREGFALINADITILAQAPRMAPHVDAMRDVIAEDLALSPSRVNVKATTTEKLGFTGRGEGIAVEAVAMLMHVDEAS
ncbi:2-C-methyl-D-erythritol 2,4-cyclodiphosphate synthase [Kushneria sp. AK178]